MSLIFLLENFDIVAVVSSGHFMHYSVIFCTGVLRACKGRLNKPAQNNYDTLGGIVGIYSNVLKRIE